MDTLLKPLHHGDSDSEVSSYRKYDRGSIPGKGRTFFSPPCPDGIWGHPNVLSNRNCVLFRRG